MTRRYSWRVSVGLHPKAVGTFLILGITASAGRVQAEATTGPTSKASNPHWQAESCGSCHRIKDAKIEAISARQAEALCLWCHDGTKARLELHPIGQKLSGEQFSKPPDWPLVEGRLTCITCHDVKMACSRSLERPLSNSAFLRDKKAVDLREFCAKCHKVEPFKKYNLHIMTDSKRNRTERACFFCHTKKLDINSSTRTGHAALRSRQAELCKTCHPLHVDYFEPGHMGQKIGPDMLAYMAASERVGSTARPSRQLIEQLKSVGARPTRHLPNEEDKIVCTTCHNPHSVGIFPDDSDLAYGAMRVGRLGDVISPVRTRQFCLDCHDK